SSAASSSGRPVSPSNSAITRLWSHRLVGRWPGSPNWGFSASVPASASSMDTDSAPASIKASDSASAFSASACRVTEIHMARSILDFAAVGELVLQIMDAGAALVEARVQHQRLVQRDVGLDALDHHLGQRDAHAADRLLAGVAIGD